MPWPPTKFAVLGYVVYILYCPMTVLDGWGILFEWFEVCCGLNSCLTVCHNPNSCLCKWRMVAPKKELTQQKHPKTVEQDHGSTKAYLLAFVNHAEDHENDWKQHVQNKEANHAMKDLCLAVLKQWKQWPSSPILFKKLEQTESSRPSVRGSAKHGSRHTQYP